MGTAKDWEKKLEKLGLGAEIKRQYFDFDAPPRKQQNNYLKNNYSKRRKKK